LGGDDKHRSGQVDEEAGGDGLGAGAGDAGEVALGVFDEPPGEGRVVVDIDTDHASEGDAADLGMAVEVAQFVRPGQDFGVGPEDPRGSHGLIRESRPGQDAAHVLRAALKAQVEAGAPAVAVPLAVDADGGDWPGRQGCCANVEVDAHLNGGVRGVGRSVWAGLADGRIEDGRREVDLGVGPAGGAKGERGWKEQKGDATEVSHAPECAWGLDGRGRGL